MAWSQANALPDLHVLNVAFNQLTGNLPREWPSTLQSLTLSGNHFNGTSFASLSSLLQLEQLSINQNFLSGQLPDDWSADDVFPELVLLDCASDRFNGSIPSSWGGPHAFQKLTLLVFDDNTMTGTLPDSWASVGAFPSMEDLELGSPSITGTLPASWAAFDAFPQLQILVVHTTQLKGSVPAFNNAHLSILDLSACSLNSSLDTFWTSAAPLKAVNLSNNNLHGHLPDGPEAFGELIVLDISQNQLDGTVPVSWLEADNLLSRVYFIDVGCAWQESTTSTNWRQQLCLKESLYHTNVTGQRIAHGAELRQSFGTSPTVGC